MSLSIKKNLFQQCVAYVQDRIGTIQDSLDSAQESANSETKSTAGDKHDTARAMMHLEVEQKTKQLQEAKKLQLALNQIKPENKQDVAQLGALVETDGGVYFLAISIGKVMVEEQAYFVISPSSPIGQAMLGLQKGGVVEFNGRKLKIKDIQ